MLPLGTAWATARKSRFFGGFLRFLTRYWKGPEQRATGRKTRAFVPAARLTGRLPVTGASGPDCPIGGPVTGCQLATGSGPVSLGQWARGMARLH